MFYINVHEGQGQRIVAVCDSTLIGKVFEEDGKCLDLERHSAFYKGRKASGKAVLEELKNFSSINIVGENATALAIENGLVEISQVLRIAGVPYAQAYRL